MSSTVTSKLSALTEKGRKEQTDRFSDEVDKSHSVSSLAEEADERDGAPGNYLD